METETGRKIKCLRSDGGKEYFCHDWEVACRVGALMFWVGPSKVVDTSEKKTFLNSVGWSGSLCISDSLKKAFELELSVLSFRLR